MDSIQKLKDQSGVVTVIVAVLMLAIISSLAVVINLGLLYQEKSQLQASTDAAALAAAIDMSEGNGAEQAQARAIQYVSENTNVPPSQVIVSFLSNQVRVFAITNRNLLISGILHRDNSQIKAESVAAYGAASGVANLAPFIVPLQRISDLTGSGNTGSIELGEDRPLDAFSIIQTGLSPMQYVITYNNLTNKTVDITIVDPLPIELSYIGGSASSGGDYNTATREVRWSFSHITPGDYRMVRFFANGDPSIVNTAYVALGNNKTASADTRGSAQRGYFWLCDFNNGSSGTPQYEEWLRTGYPDYVYAGQVANGEGMKAGLRDALEWRMFNNPNMLVPIYNWTEGGGSKGEYHVVGFAEFIITGFDLNGFPKSITGYFTDGTVAKGAPGSAPPEYFGVDTVWLVK